MKHINKKRGECEFVEVRGISSFSPGVIQSLVKNCYQDFVQAFPDEKERLYKQWEDEDEGAFNNPDTIGKHVLFTCMNNCPIGYFSWDDRQFPFGIIGQNCILAEYRRRGYGRKQIETIIQIFIENNFKYIIVTTGDHEFFLPAQKMYERCGFKINKKNVGKLFGQLEYVLDLGAAQVNPHRSPIHGVLK